LIENKGKQRRKRKRKAKRKKIRKADMKKEKMKKMVRFFMFEIYKHFFIYNFAKEKMFC